MLVNWCTEETRLQDLSYQNIKMIPKVVYVSSVEMFVLDKLW